LLYSRQGKGLQKIVAGTIFKRINIALLDRKSNFQKLSPRAPTAGLSAKRNQICKLEKKYRIKCGFKKI